MRKTTYNYCNSTITVEPCQHERASVTQNMGINIKAAIGSSRPVVFLTVLMNMEFLLNAHYSSLP